MDLGLQGKVAIVTGSSDGIGYATAHALAREGVRVVLCARREALLAEARDTIAKETEAELLAVTCDVQQLPDVQRLVTETMQASAPSIYSLTMQGAFQACSSPTWMTRSGIKYSRGSCSATSE